MNILFPGPLSAVQDMGRTGHAAQGYPECGACDKYALALGNLLCGNPETAAAIEMTLAGATVQFDQDTVIALTGAACDAKLDGQSIPLNAPVRVPAGATLETGMFAAGLRGYLCVQGGVDVTPVLGSRSTDQKCRIGGLEGRALRKGDRLPIGKPVPGYAFSRAARAAEVLADKPWLLRPRTAHAYLGEQVIPLLRAVPGPQDDAFTAEGLHTFFSGLYAVTPDSNRMGVKLSGPVVATKKRQRHSLRRHRRGLRADFRQRPAHPDARRPPDHRRLCEDRHGHRAGPVRRRTAAARRAGRIPSHHRAAGRQALPGNRAAAAPYQGADRP